MANNNYVYQQQRNVSIPRDALIQIASNEELGKKDLKVLLLLFTQLDGWGPQTTKSIRTKDPLNFKKIDIESIADSLGMKKKEVKECIEHIMSECLIETGLNDTVKNGYRFTF
jgi:hypothetical protein